jgi:hypothetical protein
MKKIKANTNQMEALVVSMTTGKPAQISELRKIDKACNVLEEKFNADDKDAVVEILVEDADFDFIKSKFNEFEGWNPQARKLVLEVDQAIQNAEDVKKE